MTGYQFVQYRPAHVPVYAPPSPPSLGQATEPQATTGFVGGTLLIGTFNAAVMGAAAWVGIRTGLREKGFYSGLGWTVGVMAGIGGLMALGLMTNTLIRSVSPKA